MTRSLFTPISAAVLASWATARMPRPSRLRLMNRSSATIITSASTEGQQLHRVDRHAAEVEHRLRG